MALCKQQASALRLLKISRYFLVGVAWTLLFLKGLKPNVEPNSG